jgi:molybdopterin-containing oxidoreductase family iron-sulfur binding subunit
MFGLSPLTQPMRPLPPQQGEIESSPSHSWRSLEDFRNSAAQRGDSGLAFSVERRRFLQSLMGASLALAAGGCARKPLEEIVPYIEGPEQAQYGKPSFYATAFTRGGYALGVLAESNMGRPTKIEGNPAHPASLGATDIFAQASVLELWDPERSQALTRDGEIATWEGFLAELTGATRMLGLQRGAGLRILTETVTSPTLAAQLTGLLERYPRAQWHQYQPLNRDNVYAGARLAFKSHLEPQYRFDRAEIVVALDADFLDAMPGSVRYARDFMGTRRAQGRASMSRLYVAESTPSLSGAAADHHASVRYFDIDLLARALARSLGVPAAGSAPDAPVDSAWFNAALQDLRAHRGRSLVIAGDQQPAQVHAMAYAINHALGNIDSTLIFTDPVMAVPIDQSESIARLSAAMHAGEVELLVILGGNPVYCAPADLDFARGLGRVKLAVHCGLYRDETAAACRWHVPAAHYLEGWSDARAFDGTITIQQPVIAPLYAGRSVHELAAALSGDISRSGYDHVLSHWQLRHAGGEFDGFWRTALHEGLIAGSALPARAVHLDRLLALPDAVRSDEIELTFRADPTIDDGRFANNAWLQELPKPISKLTWDNAVLIAPALAQRIGVQNEDVVELQAGGRPVNGPVWLTPGQPDRAVTVHLGYGRSRCGTVGAGHGFDTYSLRSSRTPWARPAVRIRATGERYPLASTQRHHSMEGRDPIQILSLKQARTLIELARSSPSHPGQDTLYPPFAYTGYAWGMSINLHACIGCGACTIACQAENNIAVVGKEEVRRGREMHWIRVDRYYSGAPDHPRTAFQPVPCMQCEHAPCEVVCPVEASVHDGEGINVQVYNRCVGTRFCSNNCPYKVRRFNFFQYAKDEPSLNAQRNPEVTVRSRGVMEKCNYCLQRIANARVEAEKDNRRIKDGEVLTACQAVCPTQAIVFGDLNDARSRVNAAKASALDYALLGELNTRPRTTYLARVVNPACGSTPDCSTPNLEAQRAQSETGSE